MTRILGRSGIEVSALGFGCWAIGGPAWRGETPVGWGAVDDAVSARALETALAHGVTFFDTADAYGAGHSERIIGKTFGRKRDEVVIATKFSNVFDEATKQLTGSDSSPEYIRSALEASLRRLETDHIDLYQFHNGGYEIDRAEAVRDLLEEFVAEGKIRYYGWSTDDPERAELFARGAHCVAVQHQMNVLNDNAAMVELCEREHLASINRGPLAMGLLTGKYSADSRLPEDDVRGPKAPGWMRYFVAGKPNAELLGRLDSVREILRSNGRSLAQGAIAWLWGRSEVTIPIPGIKSVEQAIENSGAMEKGPLSADQIEEIDGILRSAGDGEGR